VANINLQSIMANKRRIIEDINYLFSTGCYRMKSSVIFTLLTTRFSWDFASDGKTWCLMGSKRV